jgi:hypothetical protein
VRRQHTLVVRGPAQDLLFMRFTRLFDGRDDVVVVRDRRRAERRRLAAPVSCDRRRRERRDPARTWVFPPD